MTPITPSLDDDDLLTQAGIDDRWNGPAKFWNYDRSQRLGETVTLARYYPRDPHHTIIRHGEEVRHA